MGVKKSVANAICILAFVACGQSGTANSVEEFAAACMKSSNMDKTLCQCIAQKAQEKLSPNGMAFVIASLQGDEEKTAALRSRMEMQETVVAGMFMTQAPAECAKTSGN